MGLREVTTIDLGYICDDGSTPIVRKIQNLDDCMNYYWYERIDDMELKATNSTLFYDEQKKMRLEKLACTLGVFKF